MLISRQMNNPIILALIAALGFGIGTPLMNESIKQGTSSNGIMLSYAFALFFVAIFSYISGGFSGSLFESPKGIILAVAMGFCFATATKCAGVAFEFGGSVAVVATLIACYPIVPPIWSVISGEIKTLNIPAIIIGTILIVGGVVVLARWGDKTVISS